jgi:type IV pilus assembly protein PilE
MLIVVVVLAILTSIAVPSYQQSIRKGHRNDGQAALLEIAGRQEVYYAKNASYTSNFSKLNSTSATTQGYYTITIPTANSTTYVLIATPTSKGSQNQDSVLKFRLHSNGKRQFKDSTGWKNDWIGH